MNKFLIILALLMATTPAAHALETSIDDKTNAFSSNSKKIKALENSVSGAKNLLNAMKACNAQNKFYKEGACVTPQTCTGQSSTQYNGSSFTCRQMPEIVHYVDVPRRVEKIVYRNVYK